MSRRSRRAASSRCGSTKAPPSQVGDTLAVLSAPTLSADAEVATARVHSTRATLRDLEAGTDPQEIAKAAAELAAKQADATRLAHDRDRLKALADAGAIAPREAEAAATAADGRGGGSDVGPRDAVAPEGGDAQQPASRRRGPTWRRRRRCSPRGWRRTPTLCLLAPIRRGRAESSRGAGRSGAGGRRGAADRGDAVALGADIRPGLRSDEPCGGRLCGDLPTRGGGGGGEKGEPGRRTAATRTALTAPGSAAIVAINPRAEYVTRTALTEDERADLLFGVKVEIGEHDRPLQARHAGHRHPAAAPTVAVTAAIHTRALRKSFGELVAVDGLDLDVARGEVFGLLGPNGSGKTTTIRMLCGLMPPTSGEMLVVGIDAVKEPEAVRRRIGYMSQRFGLYDDLTVAENFSFYAGLYGLHGKVEARRARTNSSPTLGLDAAPEAARRHALGRMEAEARAGLCHGAQARSRLPRRADGRRRSRGAPPLLGVDPRVRGGWHDDPRHHALHGRGGAL